MRALPSAVPGPVESPSWKRQRPLPGSTRPAHGLTAAVCRRIDLTWLFYTKRCEKISLVAAANGAAMINGSSRQNLGNLKCWGLDILRRGVR